MSLVVKKNLSFSMAALNRIKIALSQQPWAIILGGQPPLSQHNRYQIISAEPIACIETYGKTSQVSYQQQRLTTNQDPLALVQDWRKKLFSQDLGQPCCLIDDALPLTELPFNGGAMGCFSYDLGRQFERMPNQAQHDLPLPDMAVGFYDWALIIDHQIQQVHLVANGPKATQIIEQRLAWLHQLTDNKANTVPFALESDWQSNMSQRQYQEKFEQVQSYLHSGDCYQVNLAQRFMAQYRGDEYQAYLTLVQANQAPFSCFMRLTQGCVLSISPERFLKLEGNKVETKPIKGTRPRMTESQADAAMKHALATAEKDRAENLMIVDLLRNDIGRVCTPGSVAVPELFAIESYPAVHHLVSTVTGELAPPYEAEDLLRACFPGGSITGAPKIRAMEIIEELEPHRRSYYCGSLGYISAEGNMDTNIAIRTVVCVHNQLYCWAGGGLVADSEAAAEYQETFDKVAKILPLLTV
ncbi:aminodeoxychorismate synthase component I [Motilimonas cestriensis]|uniref:aminodeoxychorismate synthase component I n=1 Tax=Motilimonas cestriensis TaxID=2742685 RepID=UPI003DA68DB8